MRGLSFYGEKTKRPTLKNPPKSIEIATNWLRARMAGSTLAKDLAQYCATEEAGATEDAETRKGRAQVEQAINYFLEKGEVRVSGARVRSCPKLKGGPQRREAIFEASAKDAAGQAYFAPRSGADFTPGRRT